MRYEGGAGFYRRRLAKPGNVRVPGKACRRLCDACAQGDHDGWMAQKSAMISCNDGFVRNIYIEALDTITAAQGGN